MYSNIILFYAILKRSRDCLLYPKKETVTWLSPIHKEGNGPVIVSYTQRRKRSRDCLLYPKKETVRWLSPIPKEGNGPVIVSYTQRRKRSRDCLLYTKKEMVTWLSPIHKEGNGHVIVSYTQRRKRTVFYLCVNIWLHYFYLQNVLNKNTVMTEGIQITLYSIIRSISLVRHCWVLVKTKYMYSQCETETNITLMGSRAGACN